MAACNAQLRPAVFASSRDDTEAARAGSGPPPMRGDPERPLGPAGFGAPLAMLPQAGEDAAAGMEVYNDPRDVGAAEADGALPRDHPLEPQSATHGLQVALTARVRQGVTCLARLRVPGGGRDESVVAYASAAGGLGCLQAVARPAAVAFTRLEVAATVAAVLRLDTHVGGPGQASRHSHAASWCPYSLDDPYTTERPWATGVAASGTYWATKPGEFVAQKMPLDVSRLDGSLRLLEAGGVWAEDGARDAPPGVRSWAFNEYGRLSDEQRAALAAMHRLGTAHAAQALASLAAAAEPRVPVNHF